jgi:hypothetical protein
LDWKIPSLLKRKSFMELVKDKIKEFTKIFEN